MMMDDNAPTHERRKFVKTYKDVLFQKRIVVAEVCRETYSKNDKRRSRKTATNVNINPHKLKGNAERYYDNVNKKNPLYMMLWSEIKTT